MTEEEWLACGDPTLMLEFVGKQASERKLRLFAVACCREVEQLITDDRSLRAIEVAEKFADGGADAAALLAAANAANEASYPITPMPSGLGVALWAAHLTAYAAHTANAYLVPPARVRPTYGGYDRQAFATPESFVCMVSIFVAQALSATSGLQPEGIDSERLLDAIYQRHAALVREIFGNPFRPVAFDAAWRTSDALLLANGIYAERAFDRMPILADALQDAGCTNDDILNHLRDPHATHVRGCWALDLVLGKE